MEPTWWNETHVPRWFPRALLYVFVGIVALSAGQTLVGKLATLLEILVVALFLSFAIEPAVDWLTERGWRRGLATGLVFFVTVVLGGILIFLVVSLVIRQLSTLVEDAPRLIRNATNWINKRFHTTITTTSINDQLKKYQGDLANTASNVGGQVISVTGSALAIVFEGLTVALFSFYLVADGPKLRRTICSVLPPERQRLVLSLWELAIRKTGSYLYSRILLATITIICGTIAFTVIRLPSPLALAVSAGVVAQFVPVIGTYIGGSLPALIALLNSPGKFVAVAIYLVVFQQIEIYLLAPRISARTMKIHPAVAFGSAIGGATLLGPIGAFLALPAAAIVQAFLSSYVHRYELIDPADAPAIEDQVSPWHPP